MSAASSATDYDIVSFAAEFEPQVLRLQRFLWDHDMARNAAYLDWKYRRNPYLDDVLITLALHAGRVVGMRGLFGAGFVQGDGADPVPALLASDLVIDPAHRSRFLFRKMMLAAEADARECGWRYLVNVSATPATYLHSLRMGCRLAAPFEPMIRRESGLTRARRVQRRLERLPLLWRRARRVHDLLLGDGDRFGGFDGYDGAAASAQGLTISTAKAPDAGAMAALVARTENRIGMRQRRDADFVAWRYACPRHRYRFVYAHRGADLVGFAAIQAPILPRTPYLALVDWQVADAAVWRALIGAVTTAIAPLGITIWSNGLPAELTEALAAQGFKRYDDSLGKKNYRPGILLRRLDGGNSNAADPVVTPDATWDLRMIVSDLF